VIHHVTREVPPSRLAECIRFYATLGFAQVPEPPSVAGRASWLSDGRTQIHLMPAVDAQPQRGHVAVLLADYQTTVDDLRSAGHPVESRREHWGAPRAYVVDPAGHTVELMAAAPPETGHSPWQA
jgi:catechol 2,3-dioxygenase-like lactoylglutathione lyase family enzyme